MLSGIRTGKKKAKVSGVIPENESNRQPPDQRRDGSDVMGDSNRKGGAINHSTITGSKRHGERQDDDNLSAAEKLRMALASGATMPSMSAPGPSLSSSHLDRITSKLATSRNPSSTSSATVPAADDSSYGIDEGNFVVLGSPATAYTTYSSSNSKREEDMSVSELAARERATSSSSGTAAGGGNTRMSWDEHMTRDIVRVGKKRSRKAGSKNNEDSDDEVERMKRHLPDYRNDNENDKKSAEKLEKAQQRDRRRTIDQYEKEAKITSMCSWWVNSSNFTKHRLLAFGRHVSLMMAPLNASLVPGNQFYLVPLKHGTSFVDCDDDGLWEEVALFRGSLENIFAKERKGIIMIETVLPNKGFWQTKMEVIPVPFSALQDAPMYFKSAMLEQAEDFGTHNKLIPTTVQKPLRNVIPKRFPYFYVGWGNISTSNSTGFAQIIESSTFRHDFGLDTLAGMLELDPIRFQRKAKFPKDMENKLIEEFVEKWKPFDWTGNLD